MPALNITTFDGARLLQRLNDDDEIAFVTHEGKGRWKAVSSVECLPAGKSLLWHAPSGVLLLRMPNSQEHGRAAIQDPFGGWWDPEDEAYAEGDACNYPGVIVMEIRSHQELDASLVLASFSWIGGAFSVSGRRPDPSTTRWWRRFARWHEREAQKLDIVARP